MDGSLLGHILYLAVSETEREGSHTLAGGLVVVADSLNIPEVCANLSNRPFDQGVALTRTGIHFEEDILEVGDPRTVAAVEGRNYTAGVGDRSSVVVEDSHAAGPVRGRKT